MPSLSSCAQQRWLNRYTSHFLVILIQSLKLQSPKGKTHPSMEAFNSHICSSSISFLLSTNNQQGLPKLMVDHNQWWMWHICGGQCSQDARGGTGFHIAIVLRKTNYDFTRMLLCCTTCIIPDHTGIREANCMVIIHMILEGAAMSNLVKSIDQDAWWYVVMDLDYWPYV